MGLKFANSGKSTLASSITAGQTTITVTAGQGARFPTLSGGDYFFATLAAVTGEIEIVKVTARSADLLTVVRAQEGTTGFAFAAGSYIANHVTAGQLAFFWSPDNDGSGSGLDADTLDGFQSSAGTAANTVPVRDGTGKLPGSITGDAATLNGRGSDTGTAASTIPVRDGSGNLPGNITGNAAGNAGTASQLQTPRNIQLSGDVSGVVAFSGATNVNMTTTVADDSHGHTGATVPLAEGGARSVTGQLETTYTGVPSWAKKITVTFSSVSPAGAQNIRVRLGTSAGVVTSGYSSVVGVVSTGGSIGGATATDGFIVMGGALSDAYAVQGVMTLSRSDTNTWIASLATRFGTDRVSFGGGAISLPGVLDRVQVLVDGTNTFDSGVVNVFWE